MHGRFATVPKGKPSSGARTTTALGESFAAMGATRATARKEGAACRSSGSPSRRGKKRKANVEAWPGPTSGVAGQVHNLTHGSVCVRRVLDRVVSSNKGAMERAAKANTAFVREGALTLESGCGLGAVPLMLLECLVGALQSGRTFLGDVLKVPARAGHRAQASLGGRHDPGATTAGPRFAGEAAGPVDEGTGAELGVGR